ncbi:DUF6600 domain-containing protein [Flavobacterium humi]|uniref:Uncharacterized protein n=1 Tax=Flavobacterium humi TaxID=2562683 RepID=A0A4Z0L3J3_9FLAO|nr:DUF6600 domain-containing protein [Flavobacterium humi]TGD57012.1 hypothetical protein E4635_12635 [Flavobacterium humi]
METLRKNTALLLLCLGMMGTVQHTTTAQTAVSFQLFYDNLSVHGSWIDDPHYGYVWSPRLGRDFAPYRTNGYWAYTDMGWTWVSDYSWGWAPFHYGRWFYDSYYGWLWVPDTQWGPAWVTWRYYDGYYGWAAIGPGISIDVAFGSSYSVPYNQWVFVRDRDFCRRDVSHYYVRASNNGTYIKKAVVINNIHNGNNGRYNAGPDRGHVQKRIGTAITQVHLKDRDKPGQHMTKSELQLYKPRVEKGNAKKSMPEKFVTRKERGILNNKMEQPKKEAARLPSLNQNTERKEPQRGIIRGQEKPAQREQRAPLPDLRQEQPAPRPVLPRMNTEQPRNNPGNQPLPDLRGTRQEKPHHENKGRRG